jgi:putative NADH-flavin reductase
LEVSPGVRLIDSPDFPAEYRPETAAGCVFLDKLRQEKDLEWTFLSPSYNFAPGERTGKFRLGKDSLLTDSNGDSKISMEDFAIAMADEIEKPRHARQRFTVGY